MKQLLKRLKAFIDYLWIAPDLDEEAPPSNWVPVYKQHEDKGDET